MGLVTVLLIFCLLVLPFLCFTKILGEPKKTKKKTRLHTPGRSISRELGRVFCFLCFLFFGFWFSSKNSWKSKKQKTAKNKIAHANGGE